MYYTLDWEIEYECQTNVITPHPTWELGALLILPNHLVSHVIGKNTLTHGMENKTWRKKVAGSSPPPDVDQRKDTSDTSVGSKCVYMITQQTSSVAVMSPRRARSPRVTASIRPHSMRHCTQMPWISSCLTRMAWMSSRLEELLTLGRRSTTAPSQYGNERTCLLHVLGTRA